MSVVRSEHRRKLLLGADREVVFVGRLSLRLVRRICVISDGWSVYSLLNAEQVIDCRWVMAEDSLLNCGVGARIRSSWSIPILL